MLTDNELQQIDERLCHHGLFAPAIDPRGHVNNAPPLSYVSKNLTVIEFNSRGTEARMYSKRYPDGAGKQAMGNVKIFALVEEALIAAEAGGMSPTPSRFMAQ